MADDPLGRLRARNALEAITALNPEMAGNAALCSRYLSYVKATPAMMRRNGLGQTLAVLRARANRRESAEEQAYGALYDHLQGWLCHVSTPVAPFRGAPDLMNAIVSADQQKYLAAQAEAGLYLGWLKKFANALLAEAAASTEEPV